MKGEERRLILRHLSESQYEDVMKVLGSMPYIEFKVRSEGKNYLIFFLLLNIYFIFIFYALLIIQKRHILQISMILDILC